MPTNLEQLLLEDAAAQAPAPDILARITTTVDQLRVMQRHRKQLEAALEEAQKKERELVNFTLPTLMDEARVTELTLDDDYRLIRSEEVYTNVSAENLPAVCAWLIKNKFGGIVKNVFDIVLPRGATAQANKIKKLLTKAEVTFESYQSVHSQTLKAFVKESLAESRKLPPEIKVHVQPCVELKAPKINAKRSPLV
jgi:hypothetical protein